MVYGCDPAWWKHRRGLPEFSGLKVAWEGARLEFPNIRTVRIETGKGGYSQTMQFAETGVIGGGGNSGFQAINLAAQLGGNPIILVGFDMAGAHFYGRNAWPGANNPDERNFERWMAALKSASHLLRSRGVRVINASPGSALACFEKSRGIDEALDLGRVRPARS